MAYCLRSLVQILEQVLHPNKYHKNWLLDHDKMLQIQSLFDIGSFLRDFLDRSSPQIQEQIATLENQIMLAAEKAEDIIESHITSQIISSPEGHTITISPPDMGHVLHVFEVAKQEVMEIKDDGQPLSGYVSPTTCYPDNKNVVVGVDDDLVQLRGRLNEREVTKLDIIPIVGMGGTGKTTLARILYDEYSSNNNYQFDRCAWVTFSQRYDLCQILQTLVDSVTGGKTEKPATYESIDEKKEDEKARIEKLILTLYQTLYGRTYLIVIDDIWSSKAWDDVRRTFPYDNEGCRIILTTRENTLVDYLKSNSHKMHPLDDDDSWKLLRKKVFGGESCPPELEEVGKTIAKNCGGLPLALQMIGGLLLSQEQTTEVFWEYVANNVSSFIAKSDGQFSRIFSLSFANLPHYLKPCFLYMGAFPEDFDIPASRIINLWVAEGFLYPVSGKSLEESADMHLNALVNRNLIFVRKRKDNGIVDSYGIHDLLRDLCLKKAREKKFLYVRDSKTGNFQEDDILGIRRVSVNLSGDFEEECGSLKLSPLTRSFLLTGRDTDKFVSCLCFESPLLRVLDAFDTDINYKFQNVEELLHLRYLSIQTSYRCYIPRTIAVLENLKILIVNRLKSLTILEYLPLLIHLEIDHFKYTHHKTKSFNVHENLQRLYGVPHRTLYELLGKLPKLRELGVEVHESFELITIDLTCFEKLETVYCSQSHQGCYDECVFIFALSLKNLTLRNHFLDKRLTLLDAIEGLPELQVLNLESCRFKYETWEVSEAVFCQLEYLKIYDSDLSSWSAAEFNFPVLRHLAIRNCFGLNEIPDDIGRLDTLEIIEIDNCKSILFDSARQILEEQREFGNTSLQLQLSNERPSKPDDTQ